MTEGAVLAIFSLATVAGLFVGVPWVAREFEGGGFRFTWTQSVSPRRWLLGTALALLLGVLIRRALPAMVCLRSDVRRVSGRRPDLAARVPLPGRRQLIAAQLFQPGVSHRHELHRADVVRSAGRTQAQHDGRGRAAAGV